STWDRADDPDLGDPALHAGALLRGQDVGRAHPPGQAPQPRCLGREVRLQEDQHASAAAVLHRGADRAGAGGTPPGAVGLCGAARDPDLRRIMVLGEGTPGYPAGATALAMV